MFYFVSLLFIVVFIYFVFRAEIINISLKNKLFNCIRCGYCCRFLVKLSRHEITAILNLGYTGSDFLAKRFGVSFLKKENGRCVFLKANDSSLYSCGIYDCRPSACKQFPQVRYFRFKGLDSRCKGISK